MDVDTCRNSNFHYYAVLSSENAALQTEKGKQQNKAKGMRQAATDRKHRKT